jgi:MFS superfamily sulfate permease-like transporter
VNDQAGARTPLALLVASVTLAICLLFLTGLLANLPSVVLAAIVLVAVRGLIDVHALRRLWRVSPAEFWIAMVALVGVLSLGILKGVLLAAIASLLFLLAGAAQPHVAFLGRIPGTRKYSDLARHPDNEPLQGVEIFRVESSLLYFNAEHVRQAVWAHIGSTPQLRLVVCDLSAAPRIDVSGAEMLAGLHSDLLRRGIRFCVVEAHAQVRDLLRAEGLGDRIDTLQRRLTVHDVVAELAANDPGAGASSAAAAEMNAHPAPRGLD